MDTLTIAEALVAIIADREDIDATNAIPCLRRAEATILEFTGGVHRVPLYTERTSDDVDTILILVTENGQRDIFFE
ncbi:hypothetical protein SEA_DELAGARZA_56 [Microbacterium phage DelaGarza]|nr:hypothetical protein SEA_DELAGARZA_56 [Microbacterium phage DelaGarza]